MVDGPKRAASRRGFLQGTGAVAAAGATYGALAHVKGAAAAASPAALTASAAAPAVHQLRSPFIEPPKAWAPRVWWHWLAPNITEDGIKKDLDWFQEAGIGGFHQFTGNGGSKQYVDQPLDYMTPEFKRAFQTTLEEAAARDLEATLASSAGWSITGAPFVKAEDGMKKFVWTETWVSGGAAVEVSLPQPPDAIGEFLDHQASLGGIEPIAPLYRDTYVFAYRAPDGAKPQAELAPKIFFSSYSPTRTGTTPITNGDIGVELSEADFERMTDDSVLNPIYLAGSKGWIRAEYDEPVTVGGVTIAAGGTFGGWVDIEEDGNDVRVETSQDGSAWTTLRTEVHNGIQRTLTIPATTARHFRVFWDKGQNLPISKFILRTVPTVDRWEHKANFGGIGTFYAADTPEGGITPVRPADVVDLTDAMASDGTLTWDAPDGTWVVVRLGFGLTGKENGPANSDAKGLEVDKLDPDRVRAYINTYLDSFTDFLPNELLGEDGLSGLLCDSFEAGFQSWTEILVDEFVERRGYDPVPWFPVLVGTVVSSAAESDKFLWDWRTTIGDLLAENHYGTIHDVVHERGLVRFVSQGQEDRRGLFGDDTAIRRYADVPMGASRTINGHLGGVLKEQFRMDLKGASSVAHVYGRDYAACEAFTLSEGRYGPRDAKPLADQILVAGTTQFVIHSADHQAVDGGPGTSLNGIGWFMNRNQTWAGQTRPFVDWMSRTSGLLNQGTNVADIAFFYGQDAPLCGVFQEELPQPDRPRHHYDDFVDDEILLHELAVKDGRLVTQTGQSYRLLQVGGQADRMTLEVLRKIRHFVRSGVALLGPKPTMSPSLADSDRAFQQIATELWGDGTERSRRVGNGVVLTGMNPDEALASIDEPQDFGFAEGRLTFVHRRTDDLDVYFVVNDDHAAPVETTLDLRAGASRVELWDAVTGEAWLTSFTSADGRTRVPLRLGAADSVFVVLHHGEAGAAELPPIVESPVGTTTAAWDVTFDPPRGTPDALRLDELVSLDTSSEFNVKYYSGVTVYRTTLDVAADQAALDAGRLMLDLGQVHDFAEVSINGVALDTILWRAPYRLDVSGHVRPGVNDLEVRVTNLWWNRIVGDLQPGVVDKYAVSADNTRQNAKANSKPLPSGLVGPVRLLTETGRAWAEEPEQPGQPDAVQALTAPAVAGSVEVGRTVRARPGTWSAPATYSYQWSRNGTPVRGARGASYAVTAADADTLLTVTVTASAAGLRDGVATSPGVLVRRGRIVAPAPVVAGKVRVGAKVRAKVRPGRWTPRPSRLRYRWYLDGEPIPGATDRKYRIRPKDQGKRLRVKVTGSARGYVDTSRTSAGTRVRRRARRGRS